MIGLHPRPVLAVETADHPDRVLLQLCREFHGHRRASNAITETDKASDEASAALHAASWVAVEALQPLRAHTEEGRAAKATVGIVLLMAWFDPGDSQHVDFALSTLCEVAAAS